MRDYSIASPSISGVISDDHLYFEGLRKPQALFALRDRLEAGINEKAIEKEDIAMLERYSDDLYSFFLRKLTQFAAAAPIDDEESLKLQALLQEFIKVKRLIENASKTAIMRR